MTNKEKKKRGNRKHNRIEIRGDYCVGWTTNTNAEFYFDIEDKELVEQYTWVESVLACGYHTLVAHIPVTNTTIRMHQLLGMKGYDHENRNPLDNRRSNLRPATQSQNIINTGLRKNNTSGIIGVSWCKENNKWRASITINGKMTYVGYFVSKEDAIKARLCAEKKHYGEFSPQKYLFEKYNIDDNTWQELEKKIVRNACIHKSSTRGVTWHMRFGKWTAMITVCGKIKHLGYFEHEVDAIRARLQAEVDYNVKPAMRQTHLYEQYGITTQQND